MIYLEKIKEEKNWAVDASTRPCIYASARTHDGSTRGQWMLCTHTPFLGLHACNKMDACPMEGPILLHARAYFITRKQIAWEGDTQADTQADRQMDIATTRSNRPSGPIR